jgi:alpha-methylacyl-CoA racemase
MLTGIRIIDFSAYLPGPYATLRLATLGAEVIKIEPLSGDPARNMGAQKDGNGLLFLANNRNKKSIAINIKEREGQQIVHRLVSKADVVIESFRPGVMGKLGLDYESLKMITPTLIYCSISGYGQDTSFRSLGSHDLNYMAVSGVLAQMKDQNGMPIQPTTTFADLFGGNAACEAILGALFQRERTKKGCYIDLSLTDTITGMIASHLFIYQMTDEKYGVPELSGMLVCYSLYETSDHKYVSLAALEPKFWANFCKSVGKEDWLPAQFSATDEQNDVFQGVKKVFLSKTRDEWQQFNMTVDCCLAPVLETNELSQFSYFKERKLITKSKWGDDHVKTTPFPINRAETYPPYLGEHTKEILTKILEFSPQQIDIWIKKGIIK